MDRIDDDRVREIGRQLARHDHERGRPRPVSRFWAPAYREGYEEQLRELESDHRQPVGVDPGKLLEPINDQLDDLGDLLDAESGAIGRRVALKLFPSGASYDQGTGNRERFDCIAEVVEAELRSTFGTPREGDVCVRLGYAEAVQTITAIVGVQTDDRAASELETLAGAKRKFLLAIGLL